MQKPARMKSISKKGKKIEKGPQKEKHVNQYGEYNQDNNNSKKDVKNDVSEE